MSRDAGTLVFPLSPDLMFKIRPTDDRGRAIRSGPLAEFFDERAAIDGGEGGEFVEQGWTGFRRKGVEWRHKSECLYA